jgi:hypothetical protein
MLRWYKNNTEYLQRCTQQNPKQTHHMMVITFTTIQAIELP